MIRPLDKDQSRLLANHLPDSPYTVISRAHLLWGTARAYAADLTPDGFLAAVIEDPGCPGEPMLFGQSPQALATLLAQIPDWFCVNVALELAPKLAPLLAKQTNRLIREMADVYHTLDSPPPASLLTHSAVRLLTPQDLPLLLAAPPELQGPSPQRLLQNTAAAGAIIDNRLVAIAQNYALTEGFGDIGVFTLPAWRGVGLATAAAAQVAQWLWANGRIPIWSCGEHNLASLKVAKKVGFAEYGRRLYLIPEGQLTAG